jgi:DNA-binding MltR family transcriptional regulator
MKLGILHSSELSEEGLITLFNELKSADDRTIALMIAAWIEDSFDHVFRRSLLDNKKLQNALLDTDRSLGTLHAKNYLAYLLGWTSFEVFHDIEKIRVIRNKFAHFRDRLSFRNDAIEKKCMSLEVAEAYAAGGSVVPMKSARKRYIISGVLIARELLRIAELARRPRDTSSTRPFLMSIRRMRA